MSSNVQSIEDTNASELESTAREHVTQGPPQQQEEEDEDQELQKLLLHDARDLPLSPPPAVESKFVIYFSLDFIKAGHDQYGYRHANRIRAESYLSISMLESVIAVGIRSLESGRRCCVKGSLLEVSQQLVRKPELLNVTADREGYVAIIMPKAADWLKTKGSLLSVQEYKKLREVC